MVEEFQGGPHRMQSRLGTFMVADMVGYSRLMDQDREQAIEAIRALRDTFLEPVVEKHRGEVLKRMGDGWIFAFHDGNDQVRCALEVQSALAGHGSIRLRIGAHVGEVLQDEHDFYGAGVNLAQRLQTESPPGGVMISQDLYSVLADELKGRFRDAGSFRLKNIAQPVNGFQWRPAAGTGGGDGLQREAGSVPTIAVDPFEFAPDEAEPRSVAADLRDQLIVRLSRRTGIRVLDEGSRTDRDAVYVLQGRLRVAKDRGRLNLKLVLPGEGRSVWSQQYDGDTSDIFRFSDDLIQRVDSDLRLQINAFDGDRIAHLPDDSLSVSELRSRAAGEFYKCTVESYERAWRLMDQALALNPDDAMALAMRAEGRVAAAAARHDRLDGDEVRSLESDLDAAVEASPRSDYVFCTRSLFRIFVRRDAEGAEADARRALYLSPAYGTGHECLGLSLMLAGRFDEASACLEQAASLGEDDPFLPSRLFPLALCLHIQDDQPAALRAIERAIQLCPSQVAYHRLRTLCCHAAGDDAGAVQSEAAAERLDWEASVQAPRPPLPDSLRDLADSFGPPGRRRN